ncbi:MAG: uroporphyrinogen decarboxylase family protein [Candidatus Caldatribacteriaceae bacterium]
MTPRERFLKAIHFEEGDRVPTFTTLTPQVAEKFAAILHLPLELEDSFLSTRISHTQILLHLGNDAVGIGPGRGKNGETRFQSDGTLIDEFGLVYQSVGFYDEVIKRPLAHAETPEDVLHYHLPPPLDPQRWERAATQIQRYSSSYAIIGDLEATIFELSWNLVGLEKFLMDLALGKAYVLTLLDRVMEEYALPCGRKMVALGVDVLWAGDDFGTQQGMLIAPEVFRKHFKPRYQYLFQMWKRENPELRIAYHSCGSILPIIPDLFEIGLDILNPIQPQAKGMDLGKLKKEWQGKLVLFGGVDEQEVLPFKSPSEVKEEVKRRIQEAGKGGGYIIAPSHNIQPDTPVANLLAYFEAIQEFGRYPLPVH